MMRKILILITILILSVMATSGCVEYKEEVTIHRVKTGLLIDSVYNRGWFDLPNSVELFFSDGSTIKIDGDSDNITRDVLYRLSNFYEGNTIIIFYHNSIMHRGSVSTRVVCDSFKVME